MRLLSIQLAYTLSQCHMTLLSLNWILATRLIACTALTCSMLSRLEYRLSMRTVMRLTVNIQFSIMESTRCYHRKVRNKETRWGLGPLLFCNTIQPLLSSLSSDLKLGYLDDLTLGGPVEDVTLDVAEISRSAPLWD